MSYHAINIEYKIDSLTESKVWWKHAQWNYWTPFTQYPLINVPCTQNINNIFLTFYQTTLHNLVFVFKGKLGSYICENNTHSDCDRGCPEVLFMAWKFNKITN